jgi:hypothetical protein
MVVLSTQEESATRTTLEIVELVLKVDGRASLFSHPAEVESGESRVES